jgi:hypothetical protein
MYTEDGFGATQSVNVTVYSSSGEPTATFPLVAGTFTYACNATPLYFQWSMDGGNLTYPFRQFWLSPNENATTYYLFNATLIPEWITFTFKDPAGVLSSPTYAIAERYINGTLVPVEKVLLDQTKSCMMLLEAGQYYTILLTDSTVWSYGNVLISSTGITLMVNQMQALTPTSFQYISMYVDRLWGMPYGALLINYADLQNQTTDVLIYVSFTNGTLAYSTDMVASNSFQVVFIYADNMTDYVVSATITNSVYGTFSWVGYSYGMGGTSAPFSLAFLGSWPFGSSAFIPAMLIVFAFGCFSVLNAYMGAFFGCVVATLEVYWGWIQIPSTMLVAAFGFTVLLAITYAKRRLFT